MSHATNDSAIGQIRMHSVILYNKHCGVLDVNDVAALSVQECRACAA